MSVRARVCVGVRACVIFSLFVCLFVCVCVVFHYCVCHVLRINTHYRPFSLCGLVPLCVTFVMCVLLCLWFGLFFS